MLAAEDILVTDEFNLLLKKVKEEMGLRKKPLSKIKPDVRTDIESRAMGRLSQHEMTFFYDLESGRALDITEELPWPTVSVAYSNGYIITHGREQVEGVSMPNGQIYRSAEKHTGVELGDFPSYRHGRIFDAGSWNTLLRMIRGDELKRDGLDLILNRFLGASLGNEKNSQNFVYGIKSGAIPAIEIPK